MKTIRDIKTKFYTVIGLTPRTNLLTFGRSRPKGLAVLTKFVKIVFSSKFCSNHRIDFRLVSKVSSFNSASFDMLHDHVRSAPSKIAGGECAGGQIFECLKFQSAITVSYTHLTLPTKA